MRMKREPFTSLEVRERWRMGAEARGLILVMAVLLAFGLAVLYSASAIDAMQRNKESWFYMARQLSGVGLGMVAFAVAAKLDAERFRGWARPPQITRPRTEGEIPVKDVISKALYTCAPGDDVRAALETMKSRKVRRLPVVDQGGRLAGIVSIHDIAVQSRSRGSDVAPDSVLDAFIAITAPTHVAVRA